MTEVSVIIPVHNTAPYVFKCVSSVLSQTLNNLEIIIVENCSDDGSYALCDEIAANDSRIKVLHLDKADLAHARNEGVKAASSPYVGFVDSDDYIAPEMYGALYANAVKYDADICFCNLRYEDQDGKLLPPYSSDTGNIAVLSPAETIYGIFMDKISSSACTKIFRKTLFDRFCFPEDRFYEDHDVVYRIVSECRCCIHVDRPYYSYMQRGDSICHYDTPVRRYHYFLADYGRIRFIEEDRNLFPPEQKCSLEARQISLCINHFRSFRSLPGFYRAESEMYDMRSKLLDIALGVKLSFRDRKLYLGIRYLWPLYVLRHRIKADRRNLKK